MRRGAQFPLYSVGAEMLGLYSAVPLLPGGTLGVALFSYEPLAGPADEVPPSRGCWRITIRTVS